MSDHEKAALVPLWAAAGILIATALIQVALPPFRAWEVAVVAYAGALGWGLVRFNRAAWWLATVGSAFQVIAVLATSEAWWVGGSGALVVLCLVAPPVRNSVLDASSRSSGLLESAKADDPLRIRAQSAGLMASWHAAEISEKVGRRVLVRAGIVLIGAFLLVGIVGSWHDKVRQQTGATEAVWAVSVTVFKVALCVFVVLLLMGAIGASRRKRHSGSR